MKVGKKSPIEQQRIFNGFQMKIGKKIFTHEQQFTLVQQAILVGVDAMARAAHSNDGGARARACVVRETVFLWMLKLDKIKVR